MRSCITVYFTSTSISDHECLFVLGMSAVCRHYSSLFSFISACADSLLEHWEEYRRWVSSLTGQLRVARALAIMPAPFGASLGERRPTWLVNLEAALDSAKEQFRVQKAQAHTREASLQAELDANQSVIASLREELTTAERSLTAQGAELASARRELRVTKAAAAVARRSLLFSRDKLRAARRQISRTRAELTCMKDAVVSSEAVVLAVQASEHRLMIDMEILSSRISIRQLSIS